jgi:RimJ/RimL family protein N-acetyltransferase
MAKNPVALGAIVSNTNPGIFPSREPLLGQHVKLERLTQDHSLGLHENLASKDDVWTWWPDDSPVTTPADFVRWVNEYLELTEHNRLVVWAVLPLSGPSKDKAAGLVMAQPGENLAHRVVEIGAIFGPVLQKRRAGTEAFFLLCSLLFDRLNYRRMAWKTNSLNLPSRKAAERLGLVYEGMFRQDQIFQGRNRDTVWYAMIDSEWPLCRKAFEVWLEDSNSDEHGRQRRRLQEIRESLKQI